jgi:hypothetical protein
MYCHDVLPASFSPSLSLSLFLSLSLIIIMRKHVVGLVMNNNNNNNTQNRYEDLQSKTVEVLSSLFKFFGIDYDDKVIAGLNPATTKKFTSDNLKVMRSYLSTIHTVASSFFFILFYFLTICHCF